VRGYYVVSMSALMFHIHFILGPPTWNLCYGEVKLSLYLTKHNGLKAYGDSGCAEPLVGGEWSVSRPCPGKELRYSWDRRLVGLQSRFGRYAEFKILNPTGTRTPSSQ
jgi:hypothetical protein